MAIRKGKLFRPCKKCNKPFLPDGRCTWICNECSKNRSFWKSFLENKDENKKKIDKKKQKKKKTDKK